MQAYTEFIFLFTISNLTIVLHLKHYLMSFVCLVADEFPIQKKKQLYLLRIRRRLILPSFVKHGIKIKSPSVMSACVIHFEMKI